MSIVAWFNRVLNNVFGYKKPKKVKHFNAELIDMSNVRLSWALPTVTPRQRPIQHTEISVRVASTLPWTVQDIVVPTGLQELVFIDVAPGDQFYRAVVVDVDNVRGAEVTTGATIGFDAPGVVTALTAVVE
jgi:hypothetical protein